MSKDDGSRETDNRLLLRPRAHRERREGHEPVAGYVDRGSGTRGRREREGFDRVKARSPRKLVKRFPPYHEIPDDEERREAVVALHREGWADKSIAGQTRT